jgi:hypothetical protein
MVAFFCCHDGSIVSELIQLQRLYHKATVGLVQQGFCKSGAFVLNLNIGNSKQHLC